MFVNDTFVTRFFETRQFWQGQMKKGGDSRANFVQKSDIYDSLTNDAVGIIMDCGPSHLY
jgi:hypothetical protein